MNPTIQIDQLTKIYRRRHLGRLSQTVGVVDLDLEIYPGEIFGLLGLNGAGKTTTLKLILGLIFPTTGKIQILGNSLPNDAVKSKLGYLPELPYFYRNLTPNEILKLYCVLSGVQSNIQEKQKRIDAVLEMVNLKAQQYRRMGEFSKGMLQRVGIAQSLIHDPEILIYDEPVAGLDPVGIREMRQLMLDLKTRGKTILFSSHLISEVERVSDRVGIIAAGKLIKIIRQDEWSVAGGLLEEMFITAVSAG